VCVIAVSKSHEFLLKVRRLSSFFSTTTLTPSRRRVVIFSTTTQGIRLRRRVDIFPRRRTLATFLLPSLPLEIRLGTLGSRVSSPNRVCGAPAEIFNDFYDDDNDNDSEFVNFV